MRDASVPKVVFLLSDGRTHDFPADAVNAELLRQAVPNSRVWAYGTGEYVAMNELVNITKAVGPGRPPLTPRAFRTRPRS